MKYRILLTDTININEKNFSSLFKILSSERYEVFREDIPFNFISAYGDYCWNREITSLSRILRHHSISQLYELSELRINLFDICETELMTLLITKNEFYNKQLPTDKYELFQMIHELAREDLLLNLSASLYWIKRWSSILRDLPVMHASIVFSGSSIYQKAFMSLIKRKQCRNFVIESSFTGNEYYFEEKYEHIANNTNLRFHAPYKMLLNDLKKDELKRQRDHIKATNKMRLMKNKNVKQPNCFKVIETKKPIRLAIIGQVINDYSLLEQRINSLAFYQSFLEAISPYDVEVIIKLHPWERQKANLKCPFTRDKLNQFINTRLSHSSATFHVVENYGIDTLFSQVNYVVGLNSQALIEAVFAGIKPIQFGNAFYGNKGFTYDFLIDDIENACHLISNNLISGVLSLDEWETFMDFLASYLELQLVSVRKSGESSIRNRLEQYTPVELLQNIETIDINNDNKPILTSKTQSSKSNLGKKLRKLERDPYGFFRDIKYPHLRPLKNLFRS
jgi:hypothetical protein